MQCSYSLPGVGGWTCSQCRWASRHVYNAVLFIFCTTGHFERTPSVYACHAGIASLGGATQRTQHYDTHPNDWCLRPRVTSIATLCPGHRAQAVFLHRPAGLFGACQTGLLIKSLSDGSEELVWLSINACVCGPGKLHVIGSISVCGCHTV